MGRPKKNKDVTETLAPALTEPVSSTLKADCPTITFEQNKYCALPSFKQLRDDNGLLKGITYQYSPLGFVNWRAMIPEEYVVLNREKFLKKENPVDVDKLNEEEYKVLFNKTEDKDKLIRLAGLKEVAQIRGYSQMVTEVKNFGDGPVAVCEIQWIGNFETGMQPVRTTGVGDANMENTHGLSSKYLSAIAENRAISRAIRNFLMIHTVSDEEAKFQNTGEFGEKQDLQSGPQSVLDAKLRAAKKGFPEFQQYLIENAKPDTFIAAETWEKPGDMSAQDATVALGMFNDFVSKK